MSDAVHLRVDNCATIKQQYSLSTLSANNSKMPFYFVASLVSCGGTFVASNELQTFTPNWPDNSPNNQDCYWKINADRRPFKLIVSQEQYEPNFNFVEVRRCTKCFA